MSKNIIIKFPQVEYRIKPDFAYKFITSDSKII